MSARVRQFTSSRASTMTRVGLRNCSRSTISIGTGPHLPAGGDPDGDETVRQVDVYGEPVAQGLWLDVHRDGVAVDPGPGAPGSTEQFDRHRGERDVSRWRVRLAPQRPVDLPDDDDLVHGRGHRPFPL